jgi:hypothetical protein
MEGRWFQERKEILIRELVASFVEAWCTFNALYRRQKDEGKPHYAAWESWIGTENRKGHLWRLKDLSQSIVRRPGSNPSMHEVLLDWTLGAIFHECLKIREDLFQLSHPLDVGEKTAEDELPEVREAIEEWVKRIAQIRVSLYSGLEEVHRLFQSSWKGLKGTLFTHREMGLLMRYLAENRDQLVALLGEEEWEVFMRDLHPEGESDTWSLAGESYHRGGWFERAKWAFEKALSMNVDHDRAKQMMTLIENKSPPDA